MIICSLDPGRSQTGYCVITTWPLLAVLHLERLDNVALKQWLWTALVDLVVMESFRVYKHVDLTGSNLPEVRLIGAIEEICSIREVPLAQISSSQHKTKIDDKTIRSMVNYGTNTHLRDAIRIGLWGLGWTAPEGRLK